jgi:hypothetical protein
MDRISTGDRAASANAASQAEVFEATILAVSEIPSIAIVLDRQRSVFPAPPGNGELVS